MNSRRARAQPRELYVDVAGATPLKMVSIKFSMYESESSMSS